MLRWPRYYREVTKRLFEIDFCLSTSDKWTNFLKKKKHFEIEVDFEIDSRRIYDKVLFSNKSHVQWFKFVLDEAVEAYKKASLFEPTAVIIVQSHEKPIRAT